MKDKLRCCVFLTEETSLDRQNAREVVGAVMKATRGQADAARVRELIFDRLEVKP